MILPGDPLPDRMLDEPSERLTVEEIVALKEDEADRREDDDADY